MGLSELKPKWLVTLQEAGSDEAGLVGGAGCAEEGRERGGGASGVMCGSPPLSDMTLVTAPLGT